MSGTMTSTGVLTGWPSIDVVASGVMVMASALRSTETMPLSRASPLSVRLLPLTIACTTPLSNCRDSRCSITGDLFMALPLA